MSVTTMHLGTYSQGTHKTCVSIMRWPGRDPEVANARGLTGGNELRCRSWVRNGGLEVGMSEKASEALFGFITLLGESGEWIVTQGVI